MSVQAGELFSEGAEQVFHAGKIRLRPAGQDEAVPVHQVAEPPVFEPVAAEVFGGRAGPGTDQGEQVVGGEDFLLPVFQGLVGGGAQLRGGRPGGPDHRPVLPGDGFLGEDLPVDGFLQRFGGDAAGGQGAAGVVVSVPQHGEQDVVRTDAVAAGAHRLVPRIIQDAEKFG